MTEPLEGHCVLMQQLCTFYLFLFKNKFHFCTFKQLLSEECFHVLA